MASSGDLAVIEAAYEAMCAAPEHDLAACLDADVRFHSGILRASRNPVFANLANMLAAALNFSFRLTTSATANYQRTLSAHGDVLEAITAASGRRRSAADEGTDRHRLARSPGSRRQGRSPEPALSDRYRTR